MRGCDTINATAFLFSSSMKAVSAHAHVAQDLAVLGDGAGAEFVLVVVVFVVADVQLEREIRTQRDELVELNVVANGPGQTTESSDGSGKQRPEDWIGRAILSVSAIGGPCQQNREKQSGGGVGEKAQKAPQEPVEAPVADATRFRQFERGPQQSCDQERG